MNLQWEIFATVHGLLISNDNTIPKKVLLFGNNFIIPNRNLHYVQWAEYWAKIVFIS